ncbi:hypothetical protein QBC46DRAFT_450105 [Diplogelasinospora grovesii]|uniref:Uncharacterized protein n=1 Tax=Diplogelasinospora grovesii TaxID=303347 RepID=A0AAN6N759_9PEZI|nr:hypothetical protein QBC46DRAFT_450105 [Diplogelasinospora grovesii]
MSHTFQSSLLTGHYSSVKELTLPTITKLDASIAPMNGRNQLGWRRKSDKLYDKLYFPAHLSNFVWVIPETFACPHVQTRFCAASPWKTPHMDLSFYLKAQLKVVARELLGKTSSLRREEAEKLLQDIKLSIACYNQGGSFRELFLPLDSWRTSGVGVKVRESESAIPTFAASYRWENAGEASHARSLTCTPDCHELELCSNLRGRFRCARAMYTHMSKSKGQR